MKRLFESVESFKNSVNFGQFGGSLMLGVQGVVTIVLPVSEVDFLPSNSNNLLGLNLKTTTNAI